MQLTDMYSTLETRTSGKSIPSSLGKQVTVVGRVSQLGGSNLKLVTHDDKTITVKFSSSSSLPTQDSIVEVIGTVLPDQTIQSTAYLIFEEDFDLTMYDEAMKLVDKLPIFK
ncbi:Replication protein A3, 14kDa [Oopsacas minuta]|uniref:Replication protein A3, 14kDa n=1 Tax=Oopsacas minuta TaxID=111878 RepID=A0AAV7K5K9_9METZ|nr:Replication protein A3, 14kDa [Oopsacas minuta]